MFVTQFVRYPGAWKVVRTFWTIKDVETCICPDIPDSNSREDSVTESSEEEFKWFNT